MIECQIQIGDGDITETFSKWGFVFVKSSNIFGAPLKERDSVSYAESNGEYLDSRAVMAAFDYEITFAVLGDSESVNHKIMAFNKALVAKTDGDIMTLNRIRFYCPYKRVMIEGMPTPLSEASVFWRADLDCAEVKLSIRVDRPDHCNFCYTA